MNKWIILKSKKYYHTYRAYIQGERMNKKKVYLCENRYHSFFSINTSNRWILYQKLFSILKNIYDNNKETMISIIVISIFIVVLY